VAKRFHQQTLHQTKPLKVKRALLYKGTRHFSWPQSSLLQRRYALSRTNGSYQDSHRKHSRRRVHVPVIPVTTTKLHSSTKMCFYERIDFLCGDHRWGTMRQQCPREYRTGESCRGVKLSHDDYINKVDKRCHVCEALEIKERKYHKEFSSLMRW
jgi:hypothetical protein